MLLFSKCKRLSHQQVVSFFVMAVLLLFLFQPRVVLLLILVMVISGTNTATVCPSSGTVYTAVATDANGCVATDDIKICAINVQCYAGNSNNVKVEICHIPQGNPNNRRTLCVDASAVPAHPANGCTLGACGEDCNTSPRFSQNAAGSSDVENFDVNIYPNPSKEFITITINSSTTDETIQIHMIDGLGRLVKTVNTDNSRNNILNMDVSDLAPGAYIVRIQGSTQFVTKQIVKI